MTVPLQARWAPPVDAGRHSLRRRRTLVGAAATTAAAAFVVTVALVSGGSPTAATQIAPADQPAGPTATDPEDAGDVDAQDDESEKTKIRPYGRTDVELYPGGLLAKAKGVTVTERIPNPMGYADPDYSLGIAYERDGESTWALLTYTEDRNGNATGGVSSDPAGKSFATLQQWIDDQVALQNGDDAPLQFVEFDGSAQGETLVPLDGVEILQQSADVELGGNFAGPGDPTAVAEVSVDGERWYVLARRIAGSEPEYFPTAAEVGGATLDDFLAYAEQQYAEGGGGLR